MITRVSRETVLWTKEALELDPPNPVRIRLGVYARGPALLSSDAHYLVVTGFIKLLHDLNVIRFSHSVGDDGLVFFLDVRESRSVVRSYLQNLKNFHVLGKAWDLVILDGTRVTAVHGDLRCSLLQAWDLHELARAHLIMGSRPLRFSRYFLYAALTPFARARGYGSALMHRDDAKGQTSFYHVLRGLDLIQRSLQSIDCSGISSLQELNTIARPLVRALESLGPQPGFLGELFYQTLFLATVYEQKTPADQLSERVKALAAGLDKAWKAAPETEPIARAMGISGMRGMLRAGFSPLLELIEGDGSGAAWEVEWHDDLFTDLDDLSLLLFSRFADPHLLEEMNPLQLTQVQQLARLALHGQGVDRDQFNAFFYRNHLVADGVRDQIVLARLLAFLIGEDQ